MDRGFLAVLNEAYTIQKLENGKERDLLAEYVVNLGRSALSGKSGMFFDGLVYSASLILWHIGKSKTLTVAADRVREVLNSGKSLNRLEAKSL